MLRSSVHGEGCGIKLDFADVRTSPFVGANVGLTSIGAQHQLHGERVLTLVQTKREKLF